MQPDRHYKTSAVPGAGDASASSLKLCIPIPRRRLGGLYTFLDNWRRWLDGQGIQHTQDLWGDYDILFVNSWVVPFKQVWQAKRRFPRIRVVQRVDGSARDYGRRDDGDARQARVNMLADLTIWQSEYSRFSTTRKFKVIGHPGPVIYNPVDTELFRPRHERVTGLGNVRICNTSFSINRMKGTWRIGELARRHPNCEFVLCGNYPDLPRLPNINLRGRLERGELADALRACDVYLDLSENEACPNVVLEALASGLPVIHMNSGGTPEVVGECGAHLEGDDLGSTLDELMKRGTELARLARERAVAMFAPEVVFPQYLHVMAGAARRPLPRWRDFVAAARAGYPVLPTRPRRLYWAFKRWAIDTLGTRRGE